MWEIFRPSYGPVDLDGATIGMNGQDVVLCRFDRTRKERYYSRKLEYQQSFSIYSYKSFLGFTTGVPYENICLKSTSKHFSHKISAHSL